MKYRYYSIEAPKRHCRGNRTRVLLCRIFCANRATPTALHICDMQYWVIFGPGVSLPCPRWTHPARVAVVALLVTGLVDICSNVVQGGPHEGTCHPWGRGFGRLSITTATLLFAKVISGFNHFH